MPPVSRPNVTTPAGRAYVPASLPSARSAVNVTAPPTAAGAAATGGGRTDPPPTPSLNPHEPQKRFVVPFTCPHCGHTTVAPVPGGGAEGPGPAPVAAPGGATGGGC